MKIEYARLPAVFSAISALTGYSAARAPVHAVESNRQLWADHPAPSFKRSAGWKGNRIGGTLTAGIAAIVLLVMERNLGGILPPAGRGPQSEVERLSGARLLQEQIWRPRDDTGS